MMEENFMKVGKQVNWKMFVHAILCGCCVMTMKEKFLFTRLSAMHITYKKGLRKN